MLQNALACDASGKGREGRPWLTPEGGRRLLAMPCKGVNEVNRWGRGCWAVALCSLRTVSAGWAPSCFSFSAFLLASSAAFCASRSLWAATVRGFLVAACLAKAGRHPAPNNSPPGFYALGISLRRARSGFSPTRKRRLRLLPGGASGFGSSNEGTNGAALCLLAVSRREVMPFLSRSHLKLPAGVPSAVAPRVAHKASNPGRPQVECVGGSRTKADGTGIIDCLVEAT